MQWPWPIIPTFRLSGLRLWLTGNGAAARQDFLTRCQLPPEEFFADSFDFAADTLTAMRRIVPFRQPDTGVDAR
jgi:hypothetical protein